MNFSEFDNGTQFSLGAELELRLLYKNSFLLANEYDYISQHVEEKYKNNISAEFLNSMVEINSPVFQTASELKEFFKECLQSLKKSADEKDLYLSASGAYCLKNNNIEITKNERYNEILDEHQILLKSFNICGFHTHIGFKDFNEALKAYNFSLQYLPLFLALSVSSPFFNEKLTGLQSYRQIIFDRLPKAGIPQYFESYNEIKSLYDLLENTEVIDSQKDVWWDIRIQPELKTLEFRVCDSVNDLDRMEIIITLIQSLCKLSTIAKPKRQPIQVLKQNTWSAVRYGLDGNLILNGEKYSIKEAIINLVNIFLEESIIDKIFSQRVIELLNEETMAQKMLKVYSQTNSLIEVEKLGVIK